MLWNMFLLKRDSLKLISKEEFPRRKLVDKEDTYLNLLPSDIEAFTEEYALNSTQWIKAMDSAGEDVKKKVVLRKIINDDTKSIIERFYFCSVVTEAKKSNKLITIIFPVKEVRESIMNTVIYDEAPSLTEEENAKLHNKFPNENATFRFIEKGNIEAGHLLKKRGCKPVIFISGSDKFPGENNKGNIGQEEDLYRRSTILLNLESRRRQRFVKEKWAYAIKGNGGIYCPNVLVFRKDEKGGYRYDIPAFYDFIIVPSLVKPKLKDKDDKGKFFNDKKDEEKYEARLRSALTQAVVMGHDAVVLGALGCGYGQVPAVQATKLMINLISREFSHAFKEIVLAVIDDANAALGHNTPLKSNVKVFQNAVNDISKGKYGDKCTIF